MKREPEALLWVMHTALGHAKALPDGPAWNEAMATLSGSRLAPFALHLLGTRAASLPSEARVPLEAACLAADIAAARARDQLAEIAASFPETGVPWVVLKSWPLAARLYPSPACRPSGDLDLLVSSADHRGADQALQALGYRSIERNASWHIRYLRPRREAGQDVVELHHSPEPREFGGPTADVVLASRRPFACEAGQVWVPSVGIERDLLVRHYLRHGGSQAILLLDLLLHLGSERYSHPFGALVGDDLVRLGFGRQINGPRRWWHGVLARWMALRGFEDRRMARHVSVAGLPLALAESHRTALKLLGRVVWPSEPTPRWKSSSSRLPGRWTWRLQRLARMGRD